ncbi:hypothetical protein [Ascidiimonas sp. W6]|uniref:hypothetical protein n=1 Tax=Ascidiimonas meishanensis TaxID=3128903 RepID=UPI0030EC1D67
MKILRLFSFVFFLFLLSCSSEDKPLIDIANLTGTWNLQSFDTDIKTTFNLQGIPISSDTEVIAQDIQLQISFSENPDIVTSNGSYTLVITTTVLTETETEEIIGTDDLLSGTWSATPEFIIIQSNGSENLDFLELQSVSYRIIELSASRLELRADFSTSRTVEGIETDSKIKSKLVMTR